MPASVKGGVELRKALRKFTPDLAKETQQKISGALKPITKAAKGYLPDQGSVLSGWLPRDNSESRFPAYNARLVKAGIGYKTSPSKPNRRGFRSLARVFNKSAAGAIYETMGRKTPSSRFVQNRALYRAYEENQGKAREAVLDAIKTSADKLNARASVRG